MNTATQLRQTQIEFDTWLSKCIEAQHISQLDVREVTGELLRLCSENNLSYKCFTILEDHCITKRIAVNTMITNVIGV